MNKRQAENYSRLMDRLSDLGFTRDESNQLRRIEMTLHRWSELECGDSNDWNSWAIERDETTGKPFMAVYPHTGKSYRRKVADRESGALKRLKAILDARNKRNPTTGTLIHYHQGDPRGCALYLLNSTDIPNGQSIDSCYTRGIAICS